MNVQFAGVGESSYLVRRVYVQGVLEPPARDALVDISSGGHARLAEEYVPVALDAPTAVVPRPRRAREGAVVVAFERRRQLRLRHPEVDVRAPGRLTASSTSWGRRRRRTQLDSPPDGGVSVHNSTDDAADERHRSRAIDDESGSPSFPMSNIPLIS